MKNIDCEIYIKQLITFFENNPGDLMELVGNVQKEEFLISAFKTYIDLIFLEPLVEVCEQRLPALEHV